MDNGPSENSLLNVSRFAHGAFEGLERGEVAGVSLAINLFRPEQYPDEELLRLIAHYRETYHSDLAEDIYRVYHFSGATNDTVIVFAARLHHLVAGKNPGMHETMNAQDEKVENPQS